MDPEEKQIKYLEIAAIIASGNKELSEMAVKGPPGNVTLIVQAVHAFAAELQRR